MTQKRTCEFPYAIRNPKFDLTGRRFGHLIVIEYTGKTDHNRRRIWRCRCDCNCEIEVTSNDLKGSRTVRCGHDGCRKTTADIKSRSIVPGDETVLNCTHCGRTLPRTEFFRSEKFSVGRVSVCRECHYERWVKPWRARKKREATNARPN
jgi:DNA-directed RNA polymerase subunit RPC12/RpoP